MWLLIALASMGTAKELDCPAELEQFKAHIGYGTGKRRVEALQEAKADAERAARESVCYGVGRSRRCDSAFADLVPLAEHDVIRENRLYQACYAVASDWDKIIDIDRDMKQLRRNLSNFGRRAAETASDTPVYVNGPKWASGCALGSVFDQIKEQVMAELPSVLEYHEFDPTRHAELRLKVVMGQEDSQLNGRIKLPREEGAAPVPGVVWPSDLLDDKPQDSQMCLTDDRVGVSEGQKQSDEGLKVSVSLDPTKTLFCAGEEALVRVETNQPARGRLLTADREGTVIQVWPSAGEDDLLNPAKPLTLGISMLLGEDLGQERLMMVAVPAGSSLGSLGKSQRSCRAPEPWQKRLLPPGAAVDSLAFQVTEDPRACKVDVAINQKAKEQLDKALANLSRCW